MSLGSGFLENIPHFTFTPTEHQVECVRVASTKNLTFVLSRPQEKSFLVLMMVREAANSIRSGDGKAVILLHKPQQVTLWASFLTRMTDLSVSGLTEDLPIDTGQLVAGGVLVTTHQTFSTLLARKHIDLTSCRLLLVDNCQVGLNASSALYAQYKLLPRNMAPRLVTTTPNILAANASYDAVKDGLAALPRQFGRLESLLPSHVECSCEVTSQLRYLARPRELLVLHAPGEGVEKIEEDIRKVLEDLKQFLEDHEYSLWNTYGDGFADLIADIPDPVVCPLSIIEDFLGILTELGVWCADRAALILMIKIDKLKTREKYERHFLLLSVLFTTMIKIRKMCDDAYGDLSEREKLERFSRPKLLRLVELLEIYTPAELSKTVIDESKTESVVSEVVDNELSDESKNNAKDEEKTKSTNLDSTENNECDSEKDLSSNPKDSSVTNSVPESKNPSMRPARRGGGGRRQPAQEDPDALCSLIVVDTTFTAKILYHFLKDLSRCRPDLSFLCPQYAVSDNKEPDPRDSENERKKQEEALRRFRMRECNVLVSSSILEEGIDFVKCNLVIAFDPPKTFHRYVYSKVKVKSAGGSLVQLCQTESRAQQLTRLGGYRRLEMCLLDHCTNRAAPAEEDRDADRQVALLEGYPPRPSSNEDTPYIPPLTLNTSILSLNRYCAKLPSDTFTRLTPSWTVERCSDGHFCALFLPINSPLKDLVIGRAMPTAALARRAAAFEACVRLNKIGELDNMMMPIGKESLVPPMDWGDGVRPGTTKRRQYYYKRVASCLTVTDFTGDDEKDDVVHDEVEALADKVDRDMKISTDEIEKCDEGNVTSDNQVEEDNNELDDTDDDKLKARYAKLKVPEEAQYNLYALQMRLSCPIPDEQNTRGRKIHDPADASQKIGLLLPRNMPTIPVFPIYTRSGEVLVSVQLVQEGLVLNQEQLRKIFTFHIFTFSSVLRLEKYPMVFHAENSQNCVIVAPLKCVSSAEEVKIDWEFVDIIQEIAVKKLNAVPEEERVNFEFQKDEYSDAVIMPWYRNQDQPQYFYVAEICHHLSPASDFPGQGFDTFEKYYSTKYGIKIQNRDQPLLDVDHTSARLDFLTPRYVNRKGIALPTSSEETKRNKRENLDQKQILVPELCTIHPFPASLWRQTVSLPCTLYRLNGLLIADQIRRVVSLEMRMGLPEVGVEFKWPALNFGWTLADVFVGGGGGEEGDKHVVRKKEVEKVGGVKENVEVVDLGDDEFEEEIMVNGEWDTDLGSLSDKLLNKLGEEEKRAKKKKLEIGMWTNDMAAQNSGKDWGKEEVKEDDDLDDYGDLAGVELPDNLTFIGTGLGENWGTGIKINNKKGEVLEEKGGKDWGTGIQMRNFRVGSPTFFSGSGRNNMAGLMDDLEGFSCSDSEDEWTDGEDEQLGSRIEFHGENVAETIDDTEECQAREERVARDRDQEATMVQDSQWNPMDLIDEEEENGVDDEIDAGVDVVPEDQPSGIRKPGETMKEVGRTLESGECKFEPYCPVEKSEVHLDTVLGRLALAPGLVKSQLSEETPGVILWPGIDQDQPYRFDHQPDLARTHGPDPSLVLQALTMSNSNDAINLERLETIGDSFLKYAITSYLFCLHSHIHEGKLSHLRSKQVSNLNLYKLGRSRGLGECMIASKFEPHDNWLPPTYHVPRELEQALIESGVPASHWNMADLPGIDSMTSAEICKLIREKSEALRKESDKDIEDLPSFIPYNLLTQHSIPDKSIADCVEALIGAYLISCGPRGALLFMSWLGLKVLPTDPDNCPGILEPPPSPLLKTPGISNPEGQLMYLLDGYSKFEHMIGYVWRDKSYLLQAFSHASYYPNRLTDCYQRLEFLGDAVLDYLITRHLYQDQRLHSPGALTDLRSALVNNTIFACLAVRHQFHKFFKHLSPGLQVVCDRFVRIQAENDWKVSEECYLIEEDESEEAEDIEVPKALGDIFESVAGSIFLDSGLSLDAVWKVYYRMMKDEIHQFSSHVPKSPIRELLELEPETAKFGKPEKLADGRRVRVSVEVFGKGSFKGIGRNYRIAKCTAAKCALKALRKMDHKKKQK